MRSLRHVTLYRRGGLGDTLLVLPIAAGIKSAFPTARVRLICDARWAPVPAWSEAVDAVVAAQRLPLHTLQTETPPATLRAMFQDEDLVVWYSTAGAELRAALRTLCRGELRLADPRPIRNDAHITQQLAEAVADLLSGDHVPVPRLVVPHNASEQAAQEIAHAGLQQERIALLHPGSGGKAKCWPLHDWRDLLAWLRPALGLDAVWVAGPAEIERGLLGTLPGIWIKPDLETLGGWMARCRVYVGHDSGPTHLAAQLGAPTVALFGPTSPAVWRPLGPRVWICSTSGGSVENAVRAAVEQETPPLMG